MLKKLIALVFGSSLVVAQAAGAIKTEVVEYQSQGSPMEGFVAFDESKTGKLPAVLIVPDWMGVSQFAKDKAIALAKQGYIGFVADVYGKGVRPQDHQQAGELATKYKNDRKLLREHMQGAYDKLIAMQQTDPSKIVVMGYCFGGTAALELARSGAPLVGTVTFHGGLSNPTPNDAKNIKGKVLVMHGADDPMVSPAEVAAFKDEMAKAGITITFIAYPGAVHAFTNPAAGNDNSKGMAYNAQADKKSWAEFEHFLKEVFK